MNLSTKLLRMPALSYWRYTRLARCFLSGAYPSFVETPFRTKSAQGRSQVLGQIFHAVMEQIHQLIESGKFNRPDFRDAFNLTVEKHIAELEKNPLSAQLGDIWSWPELSDIYQRMTALFDQDSPLVSEPGMRAHTEETLYAQDRLLFGQIDAFFTNEEQIDLVDYKSGTVLDEGLPKDEYVNQLLFYAYLIHQNYGVYPRQLVLTSRDFSSLYVKGSIEQSEALAEQMRNTLMRYNTAVASNEPVNKFTAPDSVICASCDAKIMCRAFWSKAGSLNLPSWAHAVIGIQSADFSTSHNGATTIEISVEQGSVQVPTLRITRIFRERYPHLKDIVGQKLLFTNLRVSDKQPNFAQMSDPSQVLVLESEHADQQI